MSAKPRLTVIGEVKACSRCGVPQPLDEAHFQHLKNRTWWNTVCRTCVREQGRETYDRRLARNRADRPPRPDRRVCVLCRIEKPGTDFTFNLAGADGYDRRCRPCRRNERRRYVAELRGKDRIEFALRRMFAAAKVRAKRADVPLDIDIPYLRSIVVTHCPALGVELIYQGDRISANSATLDKFHAKLGYVKGNVFIISCRANFIKSNASSWEVAAVGAWMQRIDATKKENTIG